MSADASRIVDRITEETARRARSVARAAAADVSSWEPELQRFFWEDLNDDRDGCWNRSATNPRGLRAE